MPYPPDDRPGDGAGATTARSRATASPARRAITWCSARPTPRNTSTQPQNTCIAEQQEALNPGLTGFATTFTGNFFVGPPDELYGPFKEPKKKPMKHAIGIDPVHSQTITKLGDVRQLPHRASAGPASRQDDRPRLRADDLSGMGVQRLPHRRRRPTAPLPYGSGPQAQSCQGCHMPNKDAHGNPYRSKIAAIQEYSNFPQAEHTLPPEDIDLPERSGFGKHTLVGLNVYPAEDGVAVPRHPRHPQDRSDAERHRHRLDPDRRSARCSIRRCNRTADRDGRRRAQSTDGTLSARVTVISKVGHKFPSGVGFRRAFLEFSVLDVNNKVLWSSGRTNGAGVHRRREGRTDRRRAVVEARLLGAHRAGDAHPPAALSGDHPAGSGADLPGAGLDAGRTSTRRCAARTPSRKASSPPASCRSAPR